MLKRIFFFLIVLCFSTEVLANELFIQKAEEYYVQGMEAHKQGKYDESIALMDSCIHYNELDGRQWPYRSANAAGWKASAYHRLGNDSIANTFSSYYMVEMYDDSLSLHADSLSYFSSKFIEEGNYDEALKYAIASNEEYKRLFGENSIDYCLSLSKIANIYNKVGDKFTACKYYEEIIIPLMKDIIGENNSDYATCLNNLAYLYSDMGDYAKAEPLYQEAIRIRKNVLGEKHPDYATSLNNLADLYFYTEEYSKAKNSYQELIAIQKDIIGENHPDYAVNLIFIATVYTKLNEYAKAESLFIESTNILKEVLGENDPSYVTGLTGLANLYDVMGEYSKAEFLYQKCNGIIKNELGYNNIIYAESLELLADFYNTHGVYVKAEPLYLESIEIKKSILGNNNSDYNASLHNLANIYVSMKNYSKAEQCYRDILCIEKIILGESNTNYAISLSVMADLYYKMAAYDKAKSFYQESLCIYKKASDEDDIQYASILSDFAMLYDYLGEQSTAESMLFEALNIYKKNVEKANPAYATTIEKLALFFMNKFDYAKAEPLYLEAMKIKKEVLGEKTPEYATSLNNLAVLYNKMGDYTKAEPLYLEAMKIKKEVLGEKTPEYATSLNNLATLYFEKGESGKAVPLYIKSLKIRKEVFGENHPDYATSLNNLAELYCNMGDYVKAEPLYQEALKIRKEVLNENHPDYAASLICLANLYSNMGDYVKAEPLYQDALKIYKEVLGENHPDYATSLYCLANLYSNMGDISKAKLLYQDALKIYKEVLGENHPYYAISLKDLAELYRAMGDYYKSESLFDEALRIIKEVIGENSLQYAKCLNASTLLYVDLGDFVRAEKIQLKVLNIYKDILGENNNYYSVSLNNLAVAYFYLNNYSKAISLYEQSLSIKRLMNSIYNASYVIVLGNLADAVYKFEKKIVKADSLYKQALHMQKEMDGECENYARLLNNYGSMLDDVGEIDSAISTFNEALKIRKIKLGENHQYTNRTIGHLARLYSGIGQNQKAELFFYKNYVVNKRLLEEGFSFMSERQRNQYYNKYEYEFNNTYPEYCYKYYPQKDSISCFAYDNELFIKGLLLNTSNSIQNSILESGDTALINKWNELRSVKERILKLQSQPLDKQIGLQELLVKAEGLDKELTKASAAYRDEQAGWGVTWNDVRKRLDKNDVAVEFVDFQDTTDVVYYALVLHKDDKYPRLVPLFRESETDSIMQSYGSKAAVYNYFEEDSTHLYDVVWKRLEPYIADGSTVYYSATGVLHQMNIEAIPVNDSTRIGDRYKMVRLSSTRQLVTGKQERRETKATVYGGIRYDLDSEVMEAESVKYADSTYYASRAIEFSQDSTLRAGVNYLPGTKRESDEISVILKDKIEKVSLMQDSVANEESFKALSGRHYNILHIATHGFFWPIEKAMDTDLFRARMLGTGDDDSQMAYRPLQDPMQRSGLILAGANLALRGGSEYIPRSVEDGILTAKEISNIDLRDADLVVLSACETGSGEVSGEGVFGLQRGFKQAGAQTIIMSLWKVDDKVTQELMEQFYRNWTSGKTKREAFNTAVTTIRTQHPEPGYWAAFIMLD